MAAEEFRQFSSLEMAIVEANAEALGVRVADLMERAGRVVAEEAARRLPPPPCGVGIVAGSGNNGGDGCAAAVALTERGYRPKLWMVAPVDRIRGAAARHWYERAADSVSVHPSIPRPEELQEFPLLIDALLGTGQSGALHPPYDEAVVAMQLSGRPVLAIDLPTGATDSRGIRARWTVALTGPKEEVPADRAGEVIVRSIGIPPEAWERTGPGEFRALRSWSSPSGRGRSGRLLLIGGGPYAGAPALAGRAALRSGAERATILAPAVVAPTIQSFGPDLIVHGIGEGPGYWTPRDLASVVETIERLHPTGLVLGMGAGDRPETRELFHELRIWLEAHPEATKVTLWDADALPALSDRTPSTGQERPSPMIATPNQGEYRRWFGGSEETTNTEVADRARQRGIYLLVKGRIDYLSDGRRVVANDHHHPAMTVGGMGDVLDGLLGGLLCQGLPPWEAGRLSLYWLGEAGRHTERRLGFGLLASDVIEELPRAATDARNATGRDQA